MPLSDAALSTLIQSQLKAAPMDVVDDAKFKAWADALAAAIVMHVVANAVVTVAVTGGSSAGVYAGTVS